MSQSMVQNFLNNDKLHNVNETKHVKQTEALYLSIPDIIKQTYIMYMPEQYLIYMLI